MERYHKYMERYHKYPYGRTAFFLEFWDMIFY